MNRPRLVFLDFESTGKDPREARIVEVAILVDEPSGEEELFHTLVNPGVPIPEAATAVHGITNSDVQEAPKFEDVADRVESLVSEGTLVGYASRRYDVVLLDAELQRVGRPGLPRDGNGEIALPEIDLFEVWRRAEPRTLVSAVRRFCGKGFDGDAHTALGDVEELPGLLWKMAEDLGLVAYEEPYPDGRGGIDQVATFGRMEELSVPEWAVDRSGKFRIEGGEIVFAFGKHKGAPAASQKSYVEWMLSADFPPDTKAWCRRILAGYRPGASRE